MNSYKHTDETCYHVLLSIKSCGLGAWIPLHLHQFYEHAIETFAHHPTILKSEPGQNAYAGSDGRLSLKNRRDLNTILKAYNNLYDRYVCDGIHRNTKHAECRG